MNNKMATALRFNRDARNKVFTVQRTKAKWNEKEFLELSFDSPQAT